MNIVDDVIALKSDVRGLRPNVPPACLGAEIDRLATEDKVLTDEQADLVRANFDGPQVVRGVAGSGKTIVLANHLAHRVADYSQQLFSGVQGDQPRIGVVCFNRSLVPFIKRRIREASDSLPHGDKLNCTVSINHLNGFMYDLSQQRTGHRLPYLRIPDFPEPQGRAVSYLERLDELKRGGVLDTFQYDTIYLDEGQDFIPEEYQLLLNLLRPHRTTGEKNLVVFYDDAQNVYARPRPKWANLGMNVPGLRTRIMKECHRNTREIIEFALNVLLGKCGRGAPGIREFADTETLKRNGLITETDRYVRAHFAKRSGPRPLVMPFHSHEAELAWLAKEVARLVDEEHVRPEDIMLLFDSERRIQGLVEAIRRACKTRIGFSQPHHDEEKDDYILKQGKITVTTTKSVKGYDGYVAFVVGAEGFPVTNEGRASFYVGCTRARLRLYVTGLDGLGTLVEEAKRVSDVLSSGP